MPPQNPFIYNPELRGTDPRYDEREGWWGRKQRQPYGDIELEPPLPVPQAPGNPFVQTPRLPGPTNERPTYLGGYQGDPDDLLGGPVSPYTNRPTPGMADMSGGSPQQTRMALAGLQSAQGDQFSPFSEGELFGMASRASETTAPGAGAFWGNKLKSRMRQQEMSEGIADKTQAAIGGAVAGAHPAMQAQQERAAMAASMPARITARGQLEAAREAGRSRFGAAEAAAQGRVYGSQMGHLDTIMNAIRTIQGKTDLSSEDITALKSLRALYDLYAEPMWADELDEQE